MQYIQVENNNNYWIFLESAMPNTPPKPGFKWKKTPAGNWEQVLIQPNVTATPLPTHTLFDLKKAGIKTDKKMLYPTSPYVDVGMKVAKKMEIENIPSLLNPKQKWEQSEEGEWKAVPYDKGWENIKTLEDIFNLYKTPREAKGQCQYAAFLTTEILDKQNIPYEILNVKYKLSETKGSNHVIIKSEGKYYDFTGKQFGQDKNVLNENEFNENYKIRQKYTKRNITP